MCEQQGAGRGSEMMGRPDMRPNYGAMRRPDTGMAPMMAPTVQQNTGNAGNGGLTWMMTPEMLASGSQQPLPGAGPTIPGLNPTNGPSNLTGLPPQSLALQNGNQLGQPFGQQQNPMGQQFDPALMEMLARRYRV